MKPKERFFFYKDGYYENCYELEHYLNESLAEKSTFPIVGARIMYGEDFFYCQEHGEVGMTGDMNCGSFCKEYRPRNGKSGRCKHHRNCYEPNGNIYIVKNGKVVSQNSV